MSDSPAAAAGVVPGESPAQTKARLRRERLAAKSGASRLQQISALQGGPPKDISEIEKDVPGNASPLLVKHSSVDDHDKSSCRRLHVVVHKPGSDEKTRMDG